MKVLLFLSFLLISYGSDSIIVYHVDPVTGERLLRQVGLDDVDKIKPGSVVYSTVELPGANSPLLGVKTTSVNTLSDQAHTQLGASLREPAHHSTASASAFSANTVRRIVLALTLTSLVVVLVIYWRRKIAFQHRLLSLRCTYTRSDLLGLHLKYTSVALLLFIASALLYKP